jgi:hypothetical protein
MARNWRDQTAGLSHDQTVEIQKVQPPDFPSVASSDPHGRCCPPLHQHVTVSSLSEMAFQLNEVDDRQLRHQRSSSTLPFSSPSHRRGGTSGVILTDAWAVFGPVDGFNTGQVSVNVDGGDNATMSS